MDKKKTLGTFLITFFSVICLAVIIYGGVSIFNSLDLKSNTFKETQTTTITDKNDIHNMNLLESIIDEDEFHLYTDNKKLILEQNGQKTDFNWAGMLTKEHVSMCYDDFDSDGKKEIAIIIDQSEKNGAVFNDVHILDIVKADNKYKYTDTKLDSNSAKWNLQMDFGAYQLENKKRVSFTVSENTYYFKSPANNKGIYYTFESMEIGTANYSVDGNVISSEISLIAGFSDFNEPVVLGSLKANLVYDSELSQYAHTDFSFTCSKEYSISPPTNENVEPWNIHVANFNVKSSNRLKISNIDFELDMDDLEYRDFDTGVSQEKYIAFIDVTESYMKVAITKNMSFDDFWLENGGCTVFIGGSNGYYINSYSEITREGNYCYLTTYFDEKITKEQAQKIIYHFGEEN